MDWFLYSCTLNCHFTIWVKIERFRTGDFEQATHKQLGCTFIKTRMQTGIIENCLIFWINGVIQIRKNELVRLKAAGHFCPPTQTPTQKSKTGFSMLFSRGIVSSLESFRMIFEALQSEILRFRLHFLGSKFRKVPEFNLRLISIDNQTKWSRFRLFQ